MSVLRTAATPSRLGFRPGLLLAGIALLFVTFPIRAQVGGGTVETGCMLDLYQQFGQGGGLNCTANDIQIAQVINLNILDDGCAFPGDMISFGFTAEVVLTAQARHDIGVYFATDGDPNGDGALTGVCSLTALPYAGNFDQPQPGGGTIVKPFVDLDSTNDDTQNSSAFGYCADGAGTFELDVYGFPQPCNADSDCSAGFTCQQFGAGIPGGSPIQDICGDIDDQYKSPLPGIFVTIPQLDAACVDTDGDGQLNLPNCTSWRQPGANDLCLTPQGAFPGAPSKCRCDIGFNIPITIPGVISAIDKVTLDADGNPLPGDPTLFDFSLTGPDADLPDNFQLADADTPHQSPGLDAGTYSLTEAPVAGWTLVSAVCASDLGNPAQDLVATGGAVVVNNGESLTCVFTNQQVAAAALTLVKTGTLDLGADGIASPGDLIHYTFEVTNTGNLDLTNVAVTDPMVSPITCPSGNPIPALAQGASETCTGSYAITQADVDAGGKTNTATADSDQTDPVTDTHTEPIPQTPALTLVKNGSLDLGADGVANPGDLINYTFQVTNSGNVTLTNVTVSDPMVTPITCPGGNPIPSLAPGASVTCTGSYAITQADIDAGQKDNTATATGTDPGGNPVSDTDTHSEPIAAPAAIQLLKNGTLDLGADGVANPGDLINYTFQVTNSGSVTLTNVTVSDPMVAPITCPGGNPIPSLAPGASVTCTGSYAITQADIDAGQKDNTATASGTDPGGNTVSDTDTHSEPIAAPAAIQLIKNGTLDLGADGVANPGDLINYTFQVTNSGSVTLTNVTVSDPMVSPITCPGGNPIPSLAPGASVTCTGSYAITQADIDAGQKDNTATASGTDPGGNTVSDTDTHSEPIAAPAAIQLIKSGSLDLGADGIANPGDLINYTFQVTNTGTVTLTNVTVSDPMVSPITCPGGNPIPSLAPGASVTCTGSYAITQADIDAGQKDNTATASGTDPGGNPVSDTDTHSEPIAAPAAIQLIKNGTLDLGADGIANPGDLINYTFQVTNSGSVTLTNVTVSDPMVAPITCPGGNPIPSLVPGASVTCTGSYAITQADIDAGQKDNTATASGTDPGGNTVSDTDTHSEPIPRTPALTLVKNGSLDLGADGVANPGDLINYTFQVTNSGSVTLTNVTVSDPMVSPITCPGGNPIPSLAPGASVTCTGSYAITQADIDAGQKDNTATASGTDPGGNTVSDTDTHSEPIPRTPALTLVKNGALDLGADGVANPGDLISYTFQVTNSGNVTLTNVAVTDPMVPAITCPSGNPIPSLAPGASETCTGSYAITQSDIEAGQKSNIATAAGTDPNGNTVSDTDTHTEPIGQTAAIQLIKNGVLDLGADGIANPGDVISYTFKVTNSGNVTLTNVAVTDPMVPAITCPSGNPIPSLAPGASVTCTGSYAITQADIDAGRKDNTATATGTDPNGNTASDTDTHTEPISTGPPQEPIACTGEAYIVQNINAQLTLVDQSTSPFSFIPIGPPAGFEYNNLGFRSTDGLLYAVELNATGNVQILQIDAAGNITGLGRPAGLPTGPRFDGGDISADGSTMFITANGQPLYKLSLTSLPSLPPVTSVAVTGATGFVFDWAFSPATGLLYGGDSTDGQLAILDPATGVRTDFAVAGLPSGVAFGAAWFDAANHLFLYENNGTIFEIDLAGPTIVGFETGPGSSRNDGAACIQSAIGAAKQMTSTTDGLPETVTIDYVFENLSTTEDLFNLSASDDLTAVFGVQGVDWTFTSISSVPASFANSSFDGSLDTELVNQLPTQSLPAGSVAGVTVTLEVLTFDALNADSQFCNQVLVVGQSAQGSFYGDLSTSGLDPDPNGDGSPGERTLSCVGFSAPAAVQLIKSGTLDLGPDGIANPGDLISYTFDVTNTGGVDLTDVTVSDPMVSPITCPSGNPIPVLAPAASETCTGTYAITQADIDAGSKDNTATATGTDPGGNPVSDQDTHSEPIPTVPSIQLIKNGTLITGSDPPAIDLVKSGALDLGANGSADPGDLIQYSFQVTNIGGVALSNVTVSDPLVPVITCPSGNPIPALLPGATETCTGSYAITQADIDAGFKNNTATATGTDPGGNPVSDQDTHNEVIPRPGPEPFICSGQTYIVQNINAQLSLVDQSTSPFTFVPVGGPAGIEYNNLGFRSTDALMYAVELNATGNVQIIQIDAAGATLGLGRPAGLPTGPRFDAGGITPDGNTMYITANNQALYKLDLTALPTLPPVASVPVTGAGGFVFDWAVNPADGLLYGGDSTQGQLAVLDPATGIRTDFNLDGTAVGLPGLPASVAYGGAWFDDAGQFFLYRNNGEIYKIDLAGLAILTSQTGPSSSRNDAAACVLPPAPPALTAPGALATTTASLTSLAGAATVPGDMISYTFEVTNTGNVTLTNVTVTDPMVSPITCPSGNPIPSLPPGASEICTGAYTVTQADIDAGAKINTATATGTDPGGNPVSDQDTHTQPLGEPATIQLVKNGSLDLGTDGVANPGDLIHYTFEVTNTGGVTLTNATVSDPMVSPITCPSGNPIPSLAPGASETCSGSYAITQADIDAGVKDNTANVTAADPGGNPVSDDDTHSEPIASGFVCGEAYLVQNVDAQLSQIDQTVSPFTFIPLGGPAGIEYNNLGFRITDQLLYAVELSASGNVQIIQIDSNGVVTGLGRPAGLPTGPRFDAGDVTPDGSTMYINTVNQPLYRLDLTGVPALPAVTSVAITGATGFVFDWAVSPIDGRLYGGDSSQGQLAILNPATGVRSDVTVAGCSPVTADCSATSLPSSVAYGGAWFNSAGRLFLYRNSGTIYEIDLAGPRIVRTQDGPGSSRNDAAACVLTP